MVNTNQRNQTCTSTKTARMHDYDDKGSSAMVMKFLNVDQLASELAQNLGDDSYKSHDYYGKLIRSNQKASK
jgi:hypothetical protein